MVLFLPCLVAFLAFHPYMFFHFLKCFFVTYIYARLSTGQQSTVSISTISAGGSLTAGMIRQQESNDRRSQRLKLAEWSAEPRIKCNSIPARPSVWSTTCVKYVFTFAYLLVCPPLHLHLSCTLRYVIALLYATITTCIVEGIMEYGSTPYIGMAL